MEFVGRIFKLMPLQTGVSERTGNTWHRQEFVFEYFEHPTDRYSDKAVITVTDDRMKDFKDGDQVIVGFGHRANEYNGRYYNELRAYKVERFLPNNGANGSNGNNGDGNGEETKSNDLPF